MNKWVRNIAAFILVLFCIQYIPIESRDGVSYLKLAVSAFCPFIWLLCSPKLSKAFVLFGIYYLLVLFAAVFHPFSLRWSTVLFLASFILVYVTFYNLVVVERAFSKEFFIRLLKGLIIAYFITLLIQQACLLAGIRYFPLINLVQYLDRGIGANSLSYEPSTVAVILSFIFLSLLRMYELDYGRRLTIGEMFKEAKWPTIGFLWVMTTMGSGTAFIGLGILILYFIRLSPAYIVSTILILALAIVVINFVDFKPLNRAVDSFAAFLTLDNDIIYETDTSAAARIIGIVNMLTKLDLSSLEGWFGHGVDYGLSEREYGDKYMVGNIADYGFLSFIIMQVIVYSCMIKRFFSLETLMWCGLGLLTLGNVPVSWGAMMIFTVVRHFQTLQQSYQCCKGTAGSPLSDKSCKSQSS